MKLHVHKVVKKKGGGTLDDVYEEEKDKKEDKRSKKGKDRDSRKSGQKTVLDVSAVTSTENDADNSEANTSTEVAVTPSVTKRTTVGEEEKDRK
jgi:hypothetical protein